MSALFVSFLLIFLAELGDKSQLVALWFATRYHWLMVLLGVAAATLVVHLGSTILGNTAADLLPEPLVLLVAGASFFGFALWGIRGDRLDDMGEARQVSLLGSFAVVAAAFFLAELGDKTQLATVTLGAREPDSFAGVWLGSTAGMVAADALAIAAGVVAGKRLPMRLLAYAAAALFAVFGTMAVARAVALLL
ncbi:MAG TPA: TMEM165/GDT1 family protein [Dehalococcoidia bacterium]|nr:TMEM165/GDT1 family protein [Dehalococcoidia bacterium]